MILAIGSVDEQVRERLAPHGPLVEVEPDDREAIGRWLPADDRHRRARRGGDRRDA